MPSLNPNTNFELKLIERKEKLFNPFYLPECSATCARVLNFLAHVQDNFGNRGIAHNPLESGEEFFITMPTITAFEQQIYLFEAICYHATNRFSDEQVKQSLTNFVEAHTIVWVNGIPNTKKGFYGNWTTKLEMYQIQLIEQGNETNNSAIVNELQFILIDQLWKKKDEKNSIEARKL